MSFREITTTLQYNEPLKRSELLGTHGVGSLKLTTWGVVMPRAIERWPLVDTVLGVINRPLPAELGAAPSEQARNIIVGDRLREKNIQQVNDPRLVRLLTLPPAEGGKGYTALRHLIAVPQVELNNFNQFKSSALRNALPPSAVHFPKYFYDPTGNPQQRRLRTYRQALEAFRLSLGKDEAGKDFKEKQARHYFVPPRSARPSAFAAGSLEKQAAARDVLEPVPVVLMCAHGHLSDVPWARYLKVRAHRTAVPGGAGLYPNLFAEDECCPTPQLLWQSRGRTTDSFAGVQLSCLSCKASTDLSVLPRIRPTCCGERPWMAAGHTEPCHEPMQYALTTGTNLYFPLGFSGIYLPERLLATAPLANPEHLGDLRSRFEEASEDSPPSRPPTIGRGAARRCW